MRLINVDELCDEIESVEYSGHDPEVERICSLIQKAKWIDAEPVRHGKWEVTPCYIKCSECGECFMLIPQNFCPACGAKMEADHE